MKRTISTLGRLTGSLLAAAALSLCGCTPNAEILPPPAPGHDSGQTEDGPGGGQAGEEIPSDDGTIVIPAPAEGAVSYESLHDPIADVGQYYFPEIGRMPRCHWTIRSICNAGNKNNSGLSGHEEGFQYHLLAQSLAGLVNRALADGRTDVGIWLEKKGEGYARAKACLGTSLGSKTAYELLSQSFPASGGTKTTVKDLVDGYVLCDVVGNNESAVAASVAAHIYNSVIVDVRDEEYVKSLGLSMTFDARNMSTKDAWTAFRDRCSNSALVIMPVKTAELREFVICNGLFAINLHKQAGSTGGRNDALFDEVLRWLAPNAPVLGWEQNVSEDVFVDKVSKTGHVMLAADWSYNHGMTGVCYRSRQTPVLARVENPRDYDYSRRRHFVSFFLSDGDNYQWVAGDGYVNDFFTQPRSPVVKMSYGLCSEALCQLSPARFEHIYSLQGEHNSIMETFGGGYFYADNYSTAVGSRKANLRAVAERTAAHMRQHGIKILHLMYKEKSDASIEAMKEACQVFVDANDQIEGIVVIRYWPYPGEKGKVWWVTNRAGYDIPIISARYEIRDTDANGILKRNQGTPQELAALAARENAGELSYSSICVHAWSTIDNRHGSGLAYSFMEAAGQGFEAVSCQELIWRIRMSERREQTLRYLSTIK